MNLFDEISKYGITQKQYEECIQLILDKKNGVINIEWKEIIKKYNLPITDNSLRKANGTIFGGSFIAEYMKYKNELQKSNDNQTIEEIQKSYGSEVSINKDGTYSSNKLLAMNEAESKNPDFILKSHGFDSTSWKLVSARNNIRQVISKQDGVITLYASYITVKPLSNDEISLKQIEQFFNKLDRHYSLPILKSNNNYSKGDKLLLIDIADLHMNLQASMFTTGNVYNADIAEKLFFFVIEDILTRTKNYNFQEIVFAIGGDMLTSDTLLGTTTKGTHQETDLHFYDIYEKVCAMTIMAIDLLKEKCKVNVIYVMGNHDEVTGFKLAKYIDAWFKNDDMVTVDYQPIARKYKKFGKTLMCFAHDGKVQKLPALIADEAREYWSDVDTVEVFLQHMHTEHILMEDNNIRIQRLPTISARSKWSSDKGYSSKRQCKTFIFDINDGLTDVLYTPIK